MKLVTINIEITNELKKFKINKDEALLYLLGTYHGINTEYISEKTRKQVNATGIVERVYKDDADIPNKITWHIPLFNEEKDETFAWVVNYMESFGRINPSRKGTKTAVTRRMKKFFTEHPEIRVDDVKAATHAYFKTVSDPQYLKSAHKFIYEGTGYSQVSLLEQFVNQVKASGVEDGRSNKMKG